MSPAALMIGASLMQAFGAISSANSQAASLNSQAAASRYNAAVARQQGDQALQVSSAQQMQQRRDARQVIGRQRAFAAQSGTGAGGSNADLLEQSETLAELDVLNTAYEGSLKARGFATQADLDDFYARSYQSQAKSVKKAGIFNAAGSLAMGAYQVNRFPQKRTTI